MPYLISLYVLFCTLNIKSTWTYNEQNMRDKFKVYIEHGYKCKLILEHKEYIITDINQFNGLYTSTKDISHNNASFA